MRSAHLFKSKQAYSFALIFLGFFMTSLSYLSWFYHLIEFVSAQEADVLSMVVAYAFQTAGVGLFALISARKAALLSPRFMLGVLLAYAALAFPALMAPELVVVLSTGYAMALLCGFIAGFYLFQLARCVPEQQRALVFGGAYCAATIAQWLLGLVDHATLLFSVDALAVHSVLVVAFLYLTLWETPSWNTMPNADVAKQARQKPSSLDSASFSTLMPDNLLPLAVTTVLFLSLVKNLGFGFPAADVIAGVDLELSRLFYAAGLLLAGFITDRHRQSGAICCLAGCVVPFIMISLADGSVSATVLWGLDYFFNGFFAVFRVVLFADIAARTDKPWLAAFGLLLGRAGESLGTAANSLLASHTTALIALAAMLFILTVFLFVRLLQCLYAAQTTPEISEEQRFESFCARYGLSGRERQVLRHILDEKSNSEIAAAMFVTEATVKFHVHNLLSKTNCKLRLELLAAYGKYSA